MSDINVLVVFYSRHGTAEQLGLAAGLGAIEARANIRLRRVADLADAATIAASPGWREHLDRMNRDYVPPRPADPAWADVIVLVTPAASSEDICGYCAALRALGGMQGKIAAPLANGQGDQALAPVYAAAAAAGLIVAPALRDGVDPVAAAREYGRRVTRMARALKGSPAEPAAAGP
jgi:NAD(P)H dehydrogenase (quinone)